MKDTIKDFYIQCASTLKLGNLSRVEKSANNAALTQKRRDLITLCVENYIKATDDKDKEKRSAYISALMLLFWSDVSKMANKCKAVSNYEYEDFVSKLYECIEAAVKYYKADKLAGKPVSAEAYIAQLIASRGATAILYESNLSKNKSSINTISLDEKISESEDVAVTRSDLLPGDDDKFVNQVSNISDYVVQTYLNNHKIVEGIIFDLIANNNCSKKTSITETRELKDGSTERYSYNVSSFWPHKLVQELSNLPEDYITYFKNRYNIDENIVKVAIDKIKVANNQKLYKYLQVCLNDASSRFKKEDFIY